MNKGARSGIQDLGGWEGTGNWSRVKFQYDAGLHDGPSLTLVGRGLRRAQSSRLPSLDPTATSASRGSLKSFYLLKLSFDNRLIYSRPHLRNLFSAKFIKHILGKGYSLPVYIEAKELSLWRTVED